MCSNFKWNFSNFSKQFVTVDEVVPVKHGWSKTGWHFYAVKLKVQLIKNQNGEGCTINAKMCNYNTKIYLIIEYNIISNRQYFYNTI